MRPAHAIIALVSSAMLGVLIPLVAPITPAIVYVCRCVFT